MAINRKDFKLVEPYKGFEIREAYVPSNGRCAFNSNGVAVQMYNQDTLLGDIEKDLDANRTEYMARK